MPTETERLYTTAELAQRFQVCRDWVRKVFRGRPGVVRLGGHMRIPESVVEEFLRERGYLHGYIHERSGGEKFGRKAREVVA